MILWVAWLHLSTFLLPYNYHFGLAVVPWIWGDQTSPELPPWCTALSQDQIDKDHGLTPQHPRAVILEHRAYHGLSFVCFLLSW